MVRLGRAAPAALLRRALVRAPARARGVLVPLAVHRRRPVPRARDLRRARLPAGARRRLVRRGRRRTRWSRRWRAPLDVRCGERGRGDRARRRARDRRAARGRRADRGRRRGLQRRRAAHARAARPAPRRGAGCARRCPASCSTSAPTGRSTALLHHTLLVGDGYREFIRAVTRGRELPRTFSTYVHAPARTEPAMAPRRRRLARRAAAGAQPARGDRLGPRRRPAARRAARRHGDELRAARDPRRGRRRAPDDAARLRARPRRGVGQRVRGRADAAPVGLLPPARTATGGSRGLYFVGGGTHPGRRRARRAARRRGHGGPGRRAIAGCGPRTARAPR